jgi:FMN-dependent NADH-azoreductase
MLVNEIQSCDVVVIGAAVYNFGIPGVLKLWIDMVARVGLTFKYTATGPQGLCEGKKAFVVLSSGGTSMGAPNDWNSPYLKYILGFMGIDDVTFIDAGASMKDPESKQKALKQVEEIEV